MISFKQGVDWIGMRPELTLAMVVGDQQYASMGYDTFLVTSINDGIHSSPGSHYDGRAFDVRVRDPDGRWAMSEAERHAVADMIQASLNGGWRDDGRPFTGDWTVIYEDGDAPHLHIQIRRLRR